MRVRVLYHDHCFDGAASAAYFTRFLKGKFHPEADYVYTGMAHKASQLFEGTLFDGDVNAIVDFKYSANPSSPGGSTTTKAPSSVPKTKPTMSATTPAGSFSTPTASPAPSSSLRSPERSSAMKRRTWRAWWSGPISLTAPNMPVLRKLSPCAPQPRTRAGD